MVIFQNYKYNELLHEKIDCMKILILDPQSKVSHRISKDTSGGYGTGNDFGDNFMAVILKRTLKYVHDWPPMFAMYSMAVLKQKGFEVEYSKKIPNNLSDFDLFIVASSIVCCETECEYIKILIKNNKSVLAIGPFATNNPDKYLEAGASVISGEPEFYFLQNNDLNKVAKKQIIHFENKHDLDDLPLPDWSSMLSKGKKASLLFGFKKSLPILATRGCPYSCFKYCVYPLQQGRKVRQRDPIKIIDELEHWYKNYNVKMFIFRDPVFSINRKHTMEFCQKLIERKLKINFVIETHLRILDSELIITLKKAGLKAVKVGVESADENVLSDANRFTIKKDEQLEKIRELEKNKILISAMFIIGFPTDNENSILKTIEYAKKLNTTFSQFSVWTPYPGTPVYQEFEDKISVKEYEKFDQYNLIYDHNILNKKQIRKLLSSCYSMYYLRYKWIKKFLFSIIY